MNSIAHITNYSTIFPPHSFKVGLSGPEKMADYWYNFSMFVPTFLSEISLYILNYDSKERINGIIQEENGEGNPGLNHATLYKEALSQIGIIARKKEIKAITLFLKNFRQIIQEQEDKEAFAIGVSFGLEIIAEDNISYLLKYSSPSDSDMSYLKNTLFFKIHLQNEIEHINSCIRNLETLKKEGRTACFYKGHDLSIQFWTNFWREVGNV